MNFNATEKFVPHRRFFIFLLPLPPLTCRSPREFFLFFFFFFRFFLSFSPMPVQYSRILFHFLQHELLRTPSTSCKSYISIIRFNLTGFFSLFCAKKWVIGCSLVLAGSVIFNFRLRVSEMERISAGVRIYFYRVFFMQLFQRLYSAVISYFEY